MDTNTLLIIAFVVLVVIFRFIVPVLRRNAADEFVAGQYGVVGGAVCPRCKLPYSRRVLSPNLLIGKLERCPHCGKIAIVRRASLADLEAAEARLPAQDQAAAPHPKEDHSDNLRQQLEDSRFEE